MKKRVLMVISVFLIISVFSACVTYTGGQSRVTMGDTTERNHLDTRLNMTDLLALARKLTNDMLMSKPVAAWGDKRPILTVAPIKNNTCFDNIPEEQIYDEVKSILVNSGVARIVSKESNNFDYILYGVLDSTQEYGERGAEVYDFIVRLNLQTKTGEDLGRWKDRIKLEKAKQPIF